MELGDALGPAAAAPPAPGLDQPGNQPAAGWLPVTAPTPSHHAMEAAGQGEGAAKAGTEAAGAAAHLPPLDAGVLHMAPPHTAPPPPQLPLPFLLARGSARDPRLAAARAPPSLSLLSGLHGNGEQGLLAVYFRPA